ncbi:MAG: hypothetical protein LBN01_05155 [Endomicrobium sp.]|jgi:hypothetical protein|nr:hypothetical protein [Endomicrobium sp.]
MKKIISLLLAMYILCGACGLKERGAETAGTAVSEQNKNNAKNGTNTPASMPDLKPTQNPENSVKGTSSSWLPSWSTVGIIAVSAVGIVVIGGLIYKRRYGVGDPSDKIFGGRNKKEIRGSMKPTSDKIFGDRDKKEIRRSIKPKRMGKITLFQTYTDATEAKFLSYFSEIKRSPKWKVVKLLSSIPKPSGIVAVDNEISDFDEKHRRNIGIDMPVIFDKFYDQVGKDQREKTVEIREGKPKGSLNPFNSTRVYVPPRGRSRFPQNTQVFQNPQNPPQNQEQNQFSFFFSDATVPQNQEQGQK